MPTVPQATPTVQSRPIDPGYQNASSATLDAFGAPQGAALAQTGARIQGMADEAGRLALRTMVEDNERELKKAEVTYRTQLLTLGHGDGTEGNRGLYDDRGEVALGKHKQGREAILAARKNLSDKITNKRVKQMFDEVTARDEIQELRRYDDFIGRERRTAADTVAQSRIDLAKNEAALRWNDRGVLQRSLETIANETRAWAQRHGVGDDVLKNETAKEHGSLVANVVKSASVASPAAAKKILSDNRDLLPAQFLARAEQDIKQAEASARAASEHAIAVRERVQRREALQAFNESVNSIIGDPNTPVDMNRVINDPRLNSEFGVEYKLRLNAMVNRASKEEARTEISARNTTELHSRMFLPPDDPRRIVDVGQLADEYNAGGLSRTDYDWLSKKLTDARSPDGERLAKVQYDFLQSYRSQFTSNMIGVPDPDGDPAFFAFSRYVDEQLQGARKRGEDPHQLLNPNSPKFIGNSVSMFQKSLQDRLRAATERMVQPTGERRQSGTKAATDYKSAEDVIQDYKDKKIDRAKAKEIMVKRGWATE